MMEEEPLLEVSSLRKRHIVEEDYEDNEFLKTLAYQIHDCYPGMGAIKSKDQLYFNTIKATLTLKSSQSNFLVDSEVYWILNDHLYWQHISQKWSNEESVLAAAHFGQSGFVAIDSHVMHQTVEEMWTALTRAGKTSVNFIDEDVVVVVEKK